MRQILEDILSLVEEGDAPSPNTIVDDQVLERNFESLRKKVFVKEKVVPLASQVPRPKKVQGTFKSGGKWAKPNTSSQGSTDATTSASRDSEAEH